MILSDTLKCNYPIIRHYKYIPQFVNIKIGKILSFYMEFQHNIIQHSSSVHFSPIKLLPAANITEKINEFNISVTEKLPSPKPGIRKIYIL